MERLVSAPLPRGELSRIIFADSKMVVLRSDVLRFIFNCDFTKTGDEEQKKRYIARHSKAQDHTISGLATAGFLARHILWNKATVRQSIDDLNRRYKSYNFIYKT